MCERVATFAELLALNVARPAGFSQYLKPGLLDFRVSLHSYCLAGINAMAGER
jgi:hypothetical protein